MTTDTSERGLERLICATLTGSPCLSAEAPAKVGDPGAVAATGVRERCVDLAQLAVFIKAVQTLSRLNRAHPKKHDVFVLDFMNDSDTIQEAFADYYRTTVLAEETDPNNSWTTRASGAG